MGIAMLNEGLKNKYSSTSRLESIHKQTIPAFMSKLGSYCNVSARSSPIDI